MTSRRKFLKQGTLGALAAGFTVGLGHKAIGRTDEGATATLGLDKAAFASQLGTTFFVHDGKRKVPLELTRVIDLGSKKTIAARKEAFALILRGGHSLSLKQNTYSFEHAKLGDFSLLLVPVYSRDKDARYYEININRLHG